MNPYTFGRLARIFESKGFIDRPQPSQVNISAVMWGLGLFAAAGGQDDDVDALAGEITPDDAARVEPLTPDEEKQFWIGYRGQQPQRRPAGRPRKSAEPRAKRTLYISESDMRVLRLVGKGNAGDGLAAVIAEYTRLPELDADDNDLACESLP